MSDTIRALRDYDGCEIGPEIRSVDNGRFLAKTGDGVFVLTPVQMQQLSRTVSLALVFRVLSGAILLACVIFFVTKLMALAELESDTVLPELGGLTPTLFVIGLLSFLMHVAGWQHVAQFGFSRIYRQTERLTYEEHPERHREWDLGDASARAMPFAGQLRLVNIGERVVMVCIITAAVAWTLIDEHIQHIQDGTPYSITVLYVLPCVLIGYYAIAIMRIRDELRRGKTA